MLRIAFFLYREWNYRIFENIYNYHKLRKDFSISTIVLTKDHQFTLDKKYSRTIKTRVVDPFDVRSIYKILEDSDCQFALFYGWSWLVKEPILSTFKCFGLHPSPLPKSRGGTPIQNQILNGVEDSALSLFQMDKGIDSGPIYKQASLSLLGNIEDVLSRMADLGTILTKELISGYLNGNLLLKSQKGLNSYPPLKRRTPAMSEIPINQIQSKTYVEINNLVRCLRDPYPNAYVKIGKSRKLTIQQVEKYPDIPLKAYLLGAYAPSLKKIKMSKYIFLKLKDGYARLVEYKLEKS